MKGHFAKVAGALCLLKGQRPANEGLVPRGPGFHVHLNAQGGSSAADATNLLTAPWSRHNRNTSLEL
jgi:hypothetical protein